MSTLETQIAEINAVTCKIMLKNYQKNGHVRYTCLPILWSGYRGLQPKRLLNEIGIGKRGRKLVKYKDYDFLCQGIFG